MASDQASPPICFGWYNPVMALSNDVDINFVPLGIGVLLADTGLSRYRLSVLSGVEHKTLYRILRGQSDVTVTTLTKLARVFNLTASELLQIGEAYYELGLFQARQSIPDHAKAPDYSPRANKKELQLPEILGQ